MQRDERVIQVLVRSAAVLLLLALLLWPVDWAVWRVRVALGSGIGEVTVSRFTVASLKGNKEDYYFEGIGPADCSVSLFAHGGTPTCWSLRHKPEVLKMY